MKPITNILLIAALICYVFLPFYDITLRGGLNGFDFTAGVISNASSFRGDIFALIPFISGFLAVGFNSLKNRLWSIGSIALILGWLFFFYTASDFHSFALNHSPEVAPSDDLGEGFAIAGVGIGYICSCTLTTVALLSAIISLMPFKFNEAIEKAVDDTIDKGLEGSRKHIKAIGHEVRDEWSKIEAKTKHGKAKKPSSGTEQQPQPVNTEDNSRFMPAGQDEKPAEQASSEENHEDHSRFMPK